ncbi:MAG: GIY-YIG nuclease family protein [Bacteroidota bacterium]|nr:GIY-YIG nuclease family protein [Bacteroidota bacterium]
MISDIVCQNNELRVGTWNISKAFCKMHSSLKDLIDKYKDFFNSFGKVLTRRVPIETAGRPVDEYLLNNHQVLFLMSLLRNNHKIVDVKAKTIAAGSVMEILKALLEFDFGESQQRYVYAAQDESGRIKIGISNNPEERIKNLNIGNADELELVFIREAEGVRYTDETLLHKQCARYNIRSEWFEKEAMECLN